MNFKLFYFLFFTSIAFSLQAQKVKIKKNIYYVEGTAYMNGPSGWDNALTPSPFTSLKSKTNVYFTYNQYKYTCLRKQHVSGTYWTQVKDVCHGGKIKFNNEGQEMYTSMDLKDIVRTMYKMGILDGEGNLIESKVKEFTTLYGEEKQIGVDNTNIKIDINNWHC